MPLMAGRLNMQIDPELHTRAKVVAALSGRKLYEVVEDALRTEVERFERARAEAEKRDH